MQSAQYSLHGNDVSIGYGNKVIAAGMHFDIQPGTFTAILGFNGSGKSTLIRTIAGLHKPVGGQIRLDKTSVYQLSAIERSRLMAIVLSNRNEIVQTLKVFEVLSLAVAPHREWYRTLSDEERMSVAAMADEMGIKQFLNRQLFELSDGEMQKVAIARALLQNTPIILLDEPTAHLDLHHKLEIYSRLQALAQSGKTIVCTSHDVELAVNTASHGLIIGEGKAQFDTIAALIDTGVIGKYFSTDQVKFDASAKRFDYSFK